MAISKYNKRKENNIQNTAVNMAIFIRLEHFYVLEILTLPSLFHIPAAASYKCNTKYYNGF